MGSGGCFERKRLWRDAAGKTWGGGQAPSSPSPSWLATGQIQVQPRGREPTEAGSKAERVCGWGSKQKAPVGARFRCHSVHIVVPPRPACSNLSGPIVAAWNLGQRVTVERGSGHPGWIPAQPDPTLSSVRILITDWARPEGHPP